jgi:hypothetical protein
MKLLFHHTVLESSLSGSHWVYGISVSPALIGILMDIVIAREPCQATILFRFYSPHLPVHMQDVSEVDTRIKHVSTLNCRGGLTGDTLGLEWTPKSTSKLRKVHES